MENFIKSYIKAYNNKSNKIINNKILHYWGI